MLVTNLILFFVHH